MIMISTYVPNQDMCGITKQRDGKADKQEAKKLLDRNYWSETVRWSTWESLAEFVSAKLFSQEVFSQNCSILDAQSKQLKLHKEI